MDKKKSSRLAGGNPLSFPTLKENLQKQPDPGKTIMEIAVLLRESDEIGIEYSTTRRWFYDKYPEYEELLTKFRKILRTQKINK